MSRRFAFFRPVLGAVLLTTAGIKLYGLSISPIPLVGWFAQSWVQLAAIEWETLLGLWLLSGAYPCASWLAALVTFTSFAAISSYLGWIGVASCGCFGVIHASPWTAFGVDLLALLTLALSHPKLGFLGEHPRVVLRNAAGWLLTFFVGMTVLAGLLTGLGLGMFGSFDAALAHLRGERISVRPSLVDAGSGSPGESLEVSVELANWTDRPVRIIGRSSDCFCVTTDELPLRLEPAESRRVPIVVRLPRTPGLFNRQVYFLTDHDQARTIVFPLTARVE